MVLMQEKGFFHMVPFFALWGTGMKAIKPAVRKRGQALRDERLISRKDGKALRKGVILKIDSSAVGMESARRYTSSKTTARGFSIMDYRQGLAQGDGSQDTGLSTSQQGKRMTQGFMWSNSLSSWQGRLEISSTNVSISSGSNSGLFQIRQTTAQYLFELFFGRGTGSRLQEWSQEYSYSQTGGMNLYGSVNQSGTVLNLFEQTRQSETESTVFSTTGTVYTADGREIKFNVDVGMSRSFEQTFGKNVELDRLAALCDPLVINLDTDVAGLSDQKFYFDIDGDGEKDEINSLNAGSGYLALDKNEDGVINDGNELFGTKSGNGFADLAKYDSDGNGWIDENDPIWSKLKIWCRDENGNDVLYRLADKGVGAICLQNVSTDFALKGEGNQTKGAIRNTGIFLYENGAAGTVQHVDVAKYAGKA